MAEGSEATNVAEPILGTPKKVAKVHFEFPGGVHFTIVKVNPS